MVCPRYELLAQQLLDNRLRPSSQATIKTALTKWWRPFCDRWERASYYVDSGDPHRGGIMASFILHMVDDGTIKYSTITGYLWAVVDAHISHGYASPLSNVRDWSQFMHAVEVEIHVPTKGRTMFPWLLFVRMLAKVNTSIPWEVGIAFLCLILFFVISRPELIPTAQSGVNGFDGGKHLRWCDLRVAKGYLEVALRAIKQDPLCKRKTHVEGVSWRAIGECTGLLHARSWFELYARVRGGSVLDEAPLFLDDKGNVLTQAAANRLLRVLCVRVSGCTAEQAELYALGGFRVLGRNALAGVAGDETARVQGMWGSDAVDYYDRPMLERVLGAAQRMAEFAGSAAMPSCGVIDSLRRGT